MGKIPRILINHRKFICRVAEAPTATQRRKIINRASENEIKALVSCCLSGFRHIDAKHLPRALKYKKELKELVKANRRGGKTRKTIFTGTQQGGFLSLIPKLLTTVLPSLLGGIFGN